MQNSSFLIQVAPACCRAIAGVCATSVGEQPACPRLETAYFVRDVSKIKVDVRSGVVVFCAANFRFSGRFCNRKSSFVRGILQNLCVFNGKKMAIIRCEIGSVLTKGKSI